MESDDCSLEDGEIVDYTPLERPPVTVPKNEYVNGKSSNFSSDEASPASSESDEDSDCEPYCRPKKQRIDRHKFKYTSSKATNKYNVWSIGLQEEALSEDLINCGVKRINRSRDVESYDYQMKYRLEGQGDQLGNPIKLEEEEDDDDDEEVEIDTSLDCIIKTNKRRRGEFGRQRHIRQRSIERDRDGQEYKNYTLRTILDLSVTDSDSAEDVAKDICAKLSETKEELILRLVNVLGNKKAIELYNMTKDIEDDGGMMVMNGSRRRTPGGVYLLLVKRDADIPQDQVKRVFTDDREMTQQFRKHRRKNIKTNDIKKTLLGDELLPNLLTRSELERNRISEVTEGEHAVSNPPPSPATDCDNAETMNVQPQQIVTYDDDFLQLNAADDDLDFF